MGNLSNVIATKTARINEIRQEAVLIEQRLASPHMSTYKASLIEPLAAEAQQLAAEIAQIEHSHQFEQEQVYERLFEERRQERALQARRQERLNSIVAERQKYDTVIQGYDWSLVPVISDLDTRRDLARAHAEKIDTRQKEATSLTSASDDFIARFAAKRGLTIEQAQGVLSSVINETTGERIESRAKDRLTAKNYLIVTDKHGTWVESDVMTNAFGDDSGDSGGE